MKPAAVKALYKRFDVRKIPFRTISLNEAFDLLRKIRPDDPVTVFTRTVADEIRKTGTPSPYRDCVVVKQRSVIINQGYEEAVNAEREREGLKPDFEAAERAYGYSIGLPFVQHVVDGEVRVYLSLHVVQDLGKEYYSQDMREHLDPDQVRQYLKPPRGAGRQGVDREVRYRNYNLLSVLAVILPVFGDEFHGFVIDPTLKREKPVQPSAKERRRRLIEAGRIMSRAEAAKKKGAAKR